MGRPRRWSRPPAGVSCDWDPVTELYVERLTPPWINPADWNNNRAEFKGQSDVVDWVDYERKMAVVNPSVKIDSLMGLRRNKVWQRE